MGGGEGGFSQAELKVGCAPGRGDSAEEGLWSLKAQARALG